MGEDRPAYKQAYVWGDTKCVSFNGRNEALAVRWDLLRHPLSRQSKEVSTTSPSWNSRGIRSHLKRLQVLYYDSLVLRRPKPGRSADHVTTLHWAQKHHAPVFQLNRRKSIASLRTRPRVPNSMRFISWPSRSTPSTYRSHLHPTE